MKPVQRYTKTILNFSLINLILWFTSIYLGVAAVFAFGYHYLPWVSLCTKPCSYWQSLYFSFVTQSTLGYGDFSPTSFFGMIMIIIQTLLGLIVFALGTGALILRFLTPSDNAVEFHDYLVYHKDEKCFRFCIVNRLPKDIPLVKIHMRLKYFRPPSEGGKFVGQRVKLVSSTITVLKSLQPTILITEEFHDERPLQEVGKGEEIYLQPDHIDPEHAIELSLQAPYYTGTIVKIKEYNFAKIVCGEYPESYKKKDFDWSDWNKVELTSEDSCKTDDCPLSKYDKCILIDKQ